MSKQPDLPDNGKGLFPIGHIIEWLPVFEEGPVSGAGLPEYGPPQTALVDEYLKTAFEQQRMAYVGREPDRQERIARANNWLLQVLYQHKESHNSSPS